MKLSLSSGLVKLHDVPLRLNGIAKSIMGARHVRGTDDWTVPATYSAIVQVVNEFKPLVDLEIDPDLREWTNEEFERVSTLSSFQALADVEGNAKLLPLQRVAVQYLLRARSGVLGYDMGGGKTVIACDALAAMPDEARTILIVCPKGVMDVWRRHIHDWTSDVTPVVASDSSAARRKAINEAVELNKRGRRVALIMNYESVWRHTRLAPYGNLRMEKCAECDPTLVDPVTKAKCETHDKELNNLQWDAVICDEAHRIINVTKQTRGVWYLTRGSEFVWALTGTPSRGSVVDFWSLLHLVDPVSWPSRSRFMERYCITAQDNWGNTQVYGVRPDRATEFQQVTARYMIRRTFEQIMAGLAAQEGREYVPIERIVEQRYVEMSAAQKTMYNDIVDNLFITTETGATIWSDNGLSEMVRLLQCASATLKAEGDPDSDDYKVEMVSPSSKVDEVVQIVDDLAGEPCIVFAVNRGLVELIRGALEKKGIVVSMIHGGIDTNTRDDEIERFQDGTAQVIVMTYATGSEGITLTRSRFQIRAQLSWSMIFNKQSVHRNYRYGQEATVLTYIDLITKDSVESRVYEAYADKLDALEAIVNDAARMKELISGRA